MLLPSDELRELSKRVDICLSGKTTPKGCDVRFRQFYWLMVYNDRGELMAANRLAVGLREQKKLGLSLPEGLVALVDDGLRAGPSLEQLERSYIEQRGSSKAFEALSEKIAAMDGVAQIRVADFLVAAAPKTADPGLSCVRGILTQAAACNHQVINHAAYARLRQSIEGFIQEHPDHQACTDLVEPLANVALKYSFDLPARCKAYAEAWDNTSSESSPVRDGLRKLSKRLLEHCASEVEQAKKKLRGMKPGAYGQVRLLSRLGRAQATLDGLKKKKTFGVMRPIHAEWRKDAAARLDQEK